MKTMSYDELVTAIMSDPVNDLGHMLDLFEASGESCWHVDRHVWDVDAPTVVGVPLVEAGCRAGFALLNRWWRQHPQQCERGVHISNPVLTIDTEWLRSDDRAPPPHVYICLGADDETYVPLTSAASPAIRTGSPMVDALVDPSMRLWRLEGKFDLLGCWFIEHKEQCSQAPA